MGRSSSPSPKRTNAKPTGRQSMQESSLPILSDQLSPQGLHHEMKFLRKRMDERRLLMWKQLSHRSSVSKRWLEEMTRPTSQFLSRSDEVPLNSQLKCLEQQVQHPKARFPREHMSHYLNQPVRIALALWLMACSHAWIVAMLFSLPNGVSVVWSFIGNVLSSFQRSAVTPTSGFLQTVLDYWQGADLDSRTSATWESEQLRKGWQRLNRAMKLGFFNVVHRYQLDNTFASSLANVNRDLSDCVLWDTYSVLRLAGVERSAGQRTLGTGPMERINKNERAHVAKICFITVPYLLHDEFKDRHGSEWMVFWHQKLFTLTDFVVAVCQAHFDDVMVLTFSQENQGLIEFHLKGLDEQERYNHLKTRFDEDLDIAARQHYMAENNSRRSRKQDATLERIETEREDVNFPIPAEASIDYRGYQPRPTQFRLVPKQPPGPPPGRLLPPPEPDVPPAAAPAYPPDVRDRPARAEAAPVSSRPTFQLRTNGYWYWSRNLADWVWYQTGNRNEHTLNDWMGRGWIDWTCRFGYRSY